MSSWLDLIPGYKDLLNSAGAALTRRAKLKFGAGFTLSDSVANNRTEITIDQANAGFGTDDIADESLYNAGTASDALDEIKGVLDDIAAESFQYYVCQKAADGTANTYGLVTDDNVDPAAAIAGTKIDPDFGAQDVVCASVDTSGGAAPTAGAINLINNALLVMASAVSGYWSARFNAQDQLQETWPSNYVSTKSADYAGISDEAKYRVTTTGTTPNTSIGVDLPDGYFGRVRVDITAEDQAAPGVFLHAAINQRVNATSGVITLGTANAEFPPDSAGAGSSWAYALSDGGSNVITLTLTGSAAITVTWLVTVTIEYGSLT